MAGVFRTNSTLTIGIGITSAAAIATGIAYYWYRQKLLQIPPKKWKKIGTLEEITIYPIKSCGGIDLDSVKCEHIGIIHEPFIDRSFALLESDTGKMITARGYPKMLKIKARIFQNWLTLSAPGMNDLEIHLDTMAEKNDMQTMNIWGSNALVTKCGPEYDRWFSKFILDKNDGLTLVYYKFHEPTKAILKELKTASFLNEDTGSLHDAASYLLINQASIDDLNKRMPPNDKVHHKQFRPNFLVKTNGPPYDEDNWNWLKIGNDVILRSVVPSYRCIFTNINHVTAERHPDGEPLKTLKSYRVWGKNKSPRMGVHFGLRNPGVVKKGDDIYIEAKF